MTMYVKCVGCDQKAYFDERIEKYWHVTTRDWSCYPDRNEVPEEETN